MGILDDLKIWYAAHPPPGQAPVYPPDTRSYGQRFPTPANRGMSSSQSSGLSSFPLVGETRTVVLDSNGNGIAQWSPGQPSPGGGVGAGRRSGYSVDLSRVDFSVGIAPGNTTIINSAVVNIYVSYGIPAFGQPDFQGTTDLGSVGDTWNGNPHLVPGDWLTVQWVGGDPNATAVMTVSGTCNPPGA